MKEHGFARMSVVLAAVLVTIVMIGFSLVKQDGGKAALIQPEYMQKLFKAGQVVQIDIIIDEAELDDMLTNAMQEEFHMASVEIDGFRVENVGLRTKGNSSLFSIAGARSNQSSSRFSFKIDFNKYVKYQSLYGLKKLNLNNCFSDATYMREYLTYEIMGKMGLATPGQTYVSLTINGKEWGLYLGVEAIEEEYVARNFLNANGDLYKPEGTGSNLKWISEDASDYTGMNLRTNAGKQDEEALIAFLAAINGQGGELSEVLDVDSALRYFAVSTALGNFDSYQGQMTHNYYLYEQDGYFTILGWDFNMSFGGFAYMRTDSGAAVAIDEPVQGALADRPLLAALLAVDEYKQRYYGYLREIAENYLSEEYMGSKVEELTALIEPFISLGEEGAAALTAFKTSFSEEAGRTPSLLNFSKEIRASILSQLDGELPKTADELGLASTGMGGGRGAAPGIGGGFPQAGADRLAVPEGMAVPEMGGFARPDLPGGGNMREIVSIMEEIRQNGLSDENRQKLLDMGISEADIEAMADGQMPGGFAQMPPGDRARPDAFGGPPPETQAIQEQAGATPDGGTAATESDAAATDGATEQTAPIAQAVPQQERWSVREDFLRPQEQAAQQAEPISKLGLIAAGILIIALPTASIFISKTRMRRFRA